ncbi:2-hydroxyacid dehydrogenase family protein [Lacticaseibacillus camelliae]|uniref:Glyoxylate reductase n=1 Tax=Lacticaseibacillus camelliae DSM 22697 = JCM 13995 TaxID=1423730 RepID=A0A0R2ER07_9LACO|nr:2-hydroxyacid dehydrogenase family protein [Lacticaseibacillus camelliae]KRN18751.1 glyoxylate reductase [Lacticaseibacillus camelliae DSM 22697 = JCM 13995]
MPKVFISDRIPKAAADTLTQAGFTVDQYLGTGLISEQALAAGTHDADFLIATLSTQVTKAVIDQAQRLKLIANYGAGFNNIDVAAASARHIPVTNTPAVSTTAVAEVTLGLMLALSHRIVEGDQLMRGAGFDGWQPLFFLGHELAGKTLGIVGAGHIGQAVAKRAATFGMNILYTQRHQLPAAREQALGATFVPFDELVSQSDIITLHAPQTAENFHQFNAETFKAMKNTALLINAARGPIIDEATLADALAAGEIAGAALDVYEHEPQVEPRLKTMKNVILTPHIGNATVEARDAMAMICANNVIRSSRGEPITPVN